MSTLRPDGHKLEMHSGDWANRVHQLCFFIDGGGWTRSELLIGQNWRICLSDYFCRAYPVLVLEVDKNAAEIFTIFLYAVIEFFDMFLI